MLCIPHLYVNDIIIRKTCDFRMVKHQLLLYNFRAQEREYCKTSIAIIMYPKVELL